MIKFQLKMKKKEETSKYKIKKRRELHFRFSNFLRNFVRQQHVNIYKERERKRKSEYSTEWI